MSAFKIYSILSQIISGLMNELEIANLIDTTLNMYLFQFSLRSGNFNVLLLKVYVCRKSIAILGKFYHIIKSFIKAPVAYVGH